MWSHQIFLTARGSYGLILLIKAWRLQSQVWKFTDAWKKGSFVFSKSLSFCLLCWRQGPIVWHLRGPRPPWVQWRSGTPTVLHPGSALAGRRAGRVTWIPSSKARPHVFTAPVSHSPACCAEANGLTSWNLNYHTCKIRTTKDLPHKAIVSSHTRCLAQYLTQYIFAVIIAIIIIISTFTLSITIFRWATCHILAVIN